MPKLIRLTTTDENARFESSFNSDIIVKPGSRIALQNLSMEVQKNVIEIDNTVNTFTYSIANVGYTAQLTTDIIYNANNYSDMLTDMSLAMNRGFKNVSSAIIGAKWNVYVNSNGRVQLDKIKTDFASFATQNRNVDSNISRTGASGLIKRNGGVPGQYDSYVTSKSPLNKGCTLFRFRLKKIGADIIDGVRIALSKKNIDNIGVIDDSKLDYYIDIASDGTGNSTTLEYTINGINSVTALKLPVDDYIFFEISEGLLRFRKWDMTTNSAEEITSVAYDYKTDLFPYIFMAGDDGYEIDTVRVNLEDVTSSFGELDTFTLGDPPNTVGNPVVRNSVNFTNPTLSQFLGFNNIQQPNITTKEYNLIADKKFQPTDISDSFLVIIDSLDLTSYDGYDNTRKSILAVVPKSDNNDNGEVIYEPQYPTFIDIDNAYDINLRNISARILKNDLGEIVTNGLSTLTLLVD